MGAGRPTKYRPEMCQKVIALMKQGKTKVQVAVALGITRETLDEWIKDPKKPEFSDALKIGLEFAQAWWEQKIQSAAVNGTGSATLFIFNMKNRFREDWRDRQEIGHDITEDALAKLRKVQSMTDDELQTFVGIAKP